MCVEINNSTKPYANFSSLGNFVEFMYKRLEKRVSQIVKNGLWMFYSIYFPEQKQGSTETTFYEQKDNIYSTQGVRITEAIKSYNALTSNQSLNISAVNVEALLNGTVQPKNPKKQSNPPGSQNITDNQVCIPPTIISFSPTGSTTSGEMPIIKISGTSLNNRTRVLMNGTPATIKEITETTITLVPNTKASSKITVITSGGTIESKDTFIFIDNSSATTQTPPPPNTTEYDKNLFTNAFALGQSQFTIGYRDGSKLGGRLSLLNGTLSQNYEVKLFLRTAQTRVEISTFVVSGGTLDKPVSYGDYLSTSNGWKETLSLASENSQLKSVNFQLYVPAFGITINEFRSIIPFDCPDEDYVVYDIISPQNYEKILKNPCCQCYSTGTDGKEIIINGVTCNPTGEGC
jgi:hypothetical protein